MPDVSLIHTMRRATTIILELVHEGSRLRGECEAANQRFFKKTDVRPDEVDHLRSLAQSVVEIEEEVALPRRFLINELEECMQTMSYLSA